MAKRTQRHTMFHAGTVILVYVIKGFVGVIEWVLIGLAGLFIFQTKASPYDVVLGLPLASIGLGLLVNTIWSTCLSVCSPRYNREACPFCKK